MTTAQAPREPLDLRNVARLVDFAKNAALVERGFGHLDNAVLVQCGRRAEGLRENWPTKTGGHSST